MSGLARAALLVALAAASACSTDDWAFCANNVCPGAADASAVGCPQGLTLCGAFCRDTRTDESHCGGCGERCTSTQVCMASRCTDVTGCAAPRTMCSEGCTDTSSDNGNCGGCGVACPVGTACSGGRCVCPVGQTLCEGACVDTASNGAHCGGCNNRCVEGQACSSGACVATCPAPRVLCGSSCTALTTDIAHCGRCNNGCASGQLCTNGQCVTPCPPPNQVCAGACTNVGTDLAHCGRCGNRCPTGQVCTAGACVVPTEVGTAGAPCTRDSDCGTTGACLASGRGFPGGYCIYACPAGDRAGDRCAQGTGTCVAAARGALLCFRTCSPGVAGMCRAGYLCPSVTTDGRVGVCYPNCTLNPGAVCGPYRCGLSGLCTSGCTSNIACSTASVCDLATSTCGCTAATNCGANQRCYVPAGASAGQCGCASSAACSIGYVCDPSTGQCV